MKPAPSLFENLSAWLFGTRLREVSRALHEAEGRVEAGWPSARPRELEERKRADPEVLRTRQAYRRVSRIYLGLGAVVMVIFLIITT
jgi:hypothetical protein